MDERTVQWDYKVEELPQFKGTKRAEMLNTFGTQGWEVCGISDNGNWNFTVVFKRPRPDVPSRPVELVDD